MTTEAPLSLTYHALLADFSVLVMPVLEQNEEKYALPLGLCYRLQQTSQAEQPMPLMMSISSRAGELCASALRTSPHYLLVQSEPLCEPALDLLANSLAERGIVLPGVTGVSDASDCFARSWEGYTSAAASLETRQRAYALRELKPQQTPLGELTKAQPEHAILILEWLLAMIAETGSANQSAWTISEVSTLIQDGNACLWRVGEEPAAMAFFNRHTRRSVAISGVYTDPEKRGRGYATALVAGMCGQELASGREFVTLFTDAENPVSNAVYQRVGFYPVCDYHQYRFF
jgi:hypothetical protein